MTDAIRQEAAELQTADQIHAIEEKIRRCHRLASVMTDEPVRAALQRLAREYETQLPEKRKRRSFMLGE